MQMRIAVITMPAKQTNTEHVIEIYRSATFLFSLFSYLHILHRNNPILYWDLAWHI